MISIDESRCPQNHRCPALQVCSPGAMSQQGFGLPEVDHDRCALCLSCVDFCPMGAIKDV